MRRRALLGMLLAAPKKAAAATIVEGGKITLPADPSGCRSWVAWVERGRLGRSVVLTLREAGQSGGRQLWEDDWRDAYKAALRIVPDWRRDGRPLLALTLRYGAAAQEVVLSAPDGAHPPRRVAERPASAMEWRVDAQGGTLLAALDRNGSALPPTCLRWNGDALMPTPCP